MIVVPAITRAPSQRFRSWTSGGSSNGPSAELSAVLFLGA